MVTTALSFSQGLFLRPPSRLGRPVPPPKQPTLMVRRRTPDSSSPTIVRMSRLPDHVSLIERELRSIFADRLQSLVAYGVRAATASGHAAAHGDGHGAHGAPAGPPTATLAIVSSLRESDLRVCADRVTAW